MGGVTTTTTDARRHPVIATTTDMMPARRRHPRITHSRHRAMIVRAIMTALTTRAMISSLSEVPPAETHAARRRSSASERRVQTRPAPSLPNIEVHQCRTKRSVCAMVVAFLARKRDATETPTTPTTVRGVAEGKIVGEGVAEAASAASVPSQRTIAIFWAL